MDCKLKCCPFCGSDAFAWYCTFDGKHKAASGTQKFCGMPTDHHLIECKRCGIRTKVYATKKVRLTLGTGGWKMARAYIAPRRKLMKSRKYNGKCEHCGTPKPLNEVYCYVDDVNPAITYNALYLCVDCYNKKYGNCG